MQSICPSTSSAKSSVRISALALSRLKSTCPFEYSGVSGEFIYFGPDFSSESSARAVNAITLPCSLAIGNVIRLRNRAYIGPPEPSACSLEENNPLARSTSSAKCPRNRSRISLKSSGAYPMRNLATASAVSPRPVRYSRARAASGDLRFFSKYAAAASWMSINCPRSPASRASSGEYARFGIGTPAFAATVRSASGKLTFSIFITKVKTVPFS